MAKAGYCKQCGANVWLTEEGCCPRGHAADDIANVYEANRLPSLQGLFGRVGQSQVLRLLIVGLLVLVLLIPIQMIGGLIQERQARQREAVGEVTSKWGKVQEIAGPALVIPYRYRVPQTGRTEIRYATFLPEHLAARGEATSEIRYRGIFAVPTYRIGLNVRGKFSRPNFAELGVNPADVVWDRAQLALGISDMRAIQDQANLHWNGRQLAFSPGVGEFASTAGTGIHVNMGKDLHARRFTFSFPLVLNGSNSLYFMPFGRDSIVRLRSNWNSPSFQGNWLPAQRLVTPNGFQATWSVPSLGRNFPQAWTSQTDMRQTLRTSRFGVSLIPAVDQYQMSDRSVKYAGLFILLTFAAVWLFEVVARLRVHPVQYFLLGFAMCVFYLLELSLSEHMAFGVAYGIAAIAIVGMVTAYGKVMLRTFGKAAIVGAVVAALYAYLYVILINEDYALLVGSIGLFIALGLIMFLTRGVNWYETGSNPLPEPVARP